MTPQREKEILELSARRTIYETVKKYSGSHFREIERKSGLSTGSVKYHLDFLSRNGLIYMQKEGNNLRYFSNDIQIKDSVLLGLLREGSVRKILMCILSYPDITHEDITSKVDLSPSTVSWHIKKLQDSKIIEPVRKGRKSHYKLIVDRQDIIKMLITYQESFLDKMVDNVIEMWDI